MSLEISRSFLGQEAITFSLFDVVSGNKVAFPAYRGDEATVLVFMCNHCPFVKHVLSVLSKMIQQREGAAVRFIALSANDPIYNPEDSVEMMKQLSTELPLGCPYLHDESQDVFRAYDIVCTPEFMVFDRNLHCCYHGRFDSSTPGSGSSSGDDLYEVLDLIAADKPVPPMQKPSMGCSVKWRN